MYTLLGATVLGFDLVRTPGGGAVATLVAEALGMGADDLVPLARAHPLTLPQGIDRREAEAADGAAASVRPMVEALGEMNRLIAGGRVTEALQVIESAPMAGLSDLLSCVRREVFDWTWRPGPDGPVQDETAAKAVEVVCDAVVAVYHAGDLRDGLVRQLVEPWATAHRLFPRRTPDLGPCHEELSLLLDRLATLDQDGWAALLGVGRQVRAQNSWAPAMHSATWSVHLSGRVREAAVAQLRAARIVADADLPAGVAARGLWNLVSGAIQSTVAVDLLDDESESRLRRPVLEALDLR
jgi:hypothetical protein